MAEYKLIAGSGKEVGTVSSSADPDDEFACEQLLRKNRSSTGRSDLKMTVWCSKHRRTHRYEAA